MSAIVKTLIKTLTIAAKRRIYTLVQEGGGGGTDERTGGQKGRFVPTQNFRIHFIDNRPSVVYNAVTMSDFLTIYHTTHDSCYEEYQELRINLANVIWCGLSYGVYG